jgi:hypothetical protein
MKFGKKKKVKTQSAQPTYFNSDPAPFVPPAPPLWIGPPQGNFAATCTGKPLPPEAKGTVKGLQIFLNRRGFGPVAVNGVCGYQTFNAWDKWERAKTRIGTNQTQPANPPSGPTPPILYVPGKDISPPFLPPPEKKPIWKQPVFIAAAAVIVVLILTRSK